MWRNRVLEVPWRERDFSGSLPELGELVSSSAVMANVEQGLADGLKSSLKPGCVSGISC